MRKALQTIGLTLLIAVITLAAVLYFFDRSTANANLTPADVQARKLMPYLRDGQTFRLTDAYPAAWDSVQVVGPTDALTDSEWRALRAYSGEITELTQKQELLVFWLDGNIASVVRFDISSGNAPWFLTEGRQGDSLILPRVRAVFRATLTHADGYDYYACVPESDASQV